MYWLHRRWVFKILVHEKGHIIYFATKFPYIVMYGNLSIMISSAWWNITTLYSEKNSKIFLWNYKRNIFIILKSNTWHQKAKYFVNNICSNTAWNNNYEQFSSALTHASHKSTYIFIMFSLCRRLIMLALRIAMVCGLFA